MSVDMGVKHGSVGTDGTDAQYLCLQDNVLHTGGPVFVSSQEEHEFDRP